MSAAILGKIGRTLGHTAGASEPSAPTFLSATAGDGQVIVTFTAASGTDVVYPIWRTEEGNWSSPSDSFKNTGSGSVTVTSLTNKVKLEFALVSKASGLYSLPSRTMWRTPTDGSLLYGPCHALRDKLKASATVIALVPAARITPLVRSSGVTLPCILFRQISGDGAHHMTAAAGHAYARIQVQMLAADPETAKTIADACRRALDGYSGTVSGTNGNLAIDNLWLDGRDRDMPPVREPGGRRYYYEVQQDYMMGHAESVPTF